MRRGSVPCAMRWATRWTRVAVFPVPAPGDDQQGAVAMANRLPLLGIEPIEDFVLELGFVHG